MKTSTPESGESTPPGVVLRAIANEQRRVVLRSLAHADGNVMEVSALVDQVAEHVRDGEPPDGEHRRRVRTALHHVHLPKMQADGMIVHDDETSQVRYVDGGLDQELLAVIAPYEPRE